jgi:glutathione S-transferase
MESIASNVLPRHLSQLERVLADGGTDWMAGTDKPTICDFTLVCVPMRPWPDLGWGAGVRQREM